MEYAAGLMGEPGLKYTYAEVYYGVQDFDCGVFLSDEFLLAHPDYKITVELRMFNPKNEEESYIIGETYEYDNPIVAKLVDAEGNTLGGYESVAEAIAAADAGQTIIMVADSVETSGLVLFEGIDLNLNGKILTAPYVVAFAGNTMYNTASDGSGKLVCSNVALDGNTNMKTTGRAYLPIWNGDGYVFDQHNIVCRLLEDTDKGEIEFRIDPRLRFNRDLLADGITDNKLTMVVRLTWETEDGIAYQNFVYNEDMVKDVFTSPLTAQGGNSTLFNIITTDYEQWTNLTYTAMLISEGKVEATSSTFEVN